MVERTLTVTAPLGLHARAAARLVRLVSGFHCKVELCRVDSGLSADAKSILSVLMLAASRGTELRASADGADEEAAMSAIGQLFSNGFSGPETQLSND